MRMRSKVNARKSRRDCNDVVIKGPDGTGMGQSDGPRDWGQVGPE